MASKKNVDHWYESFRRELTENFGIDLNNRQDAERIQALTIDGTTTKPLFPNGFWDSPENRSKLYDNAKLGMLYAFSKQDNKAFQLNANQDMECRSKSTEVKGVPPEKPGVLYQLFTILTLGILELALKKNKTYEKDKKTFEKNNGIRRLSGMEKFLNRITFGLLYHGRRLDYQRSWAQLRERGNARHVLEARAAYFRERKDTAALQPEKEENGRQKNIENVREQSREAGNVKQEMEPRKEENGKFDFGQDGGIKGSPEAKSNMFQTMMRQEYALMLEAFGPNGGGWAEIMKHAGNMDKMVQSVKENPEMMAALGSEFSVKGLDEVSNMCRAFHYLGERGKKAEKQFMDTAAYASLPPKEKEQYIRDFVEMNMMENMMTNFAMARGRNSMQKNAMKSMQDFLKEMGKHPEKYKEIADQMADRMNITNMMRDMEPEKLVQFISAPGTMQRQIAKDFCDIIQKQQGLELKRSRSVQKKAPQTEEQRIETEYGGR